MGEGERRRFSSLFERGLTFPFKRRKKDSGEEDGRGENSGSFVMQKKIGTMGAEAGAELLPLLLLLSCTYYRMYSGRTYGQYLL